MRATRATASAKRPHVNPPGDADAAEVKESRAEPLRRKERGGLAPFLKWAGGKRSLLPSLLPLVPSAIDTYYEPFIGGGALFFELARQGRFARAKLGDQNEELIRCYVAIKRDVSEVIKTLEGLRYGEEAFYEVRDRNPAGLTDAARAARTIYLNRCGYNGLYRVNRAGEFNVPFGHHRNPRLVHPERLGLVSAALQKADLVVGDFETLVRAAGPDDFVYFDPPYVPVSATANFTAYARDGFAAPDQERLAHLLRGLGERGVKALLSNSDCLTTRRLYRGLPRVRVDVRRTINSNATKRGPVSELIVRSFAYPCRPRAKG